MKKLLIVDDHPLMRRGLTALIESEPDLSIAAEASTSRGALELVRQTEPDLVIVDLALGEDDGLSLIKEMDSRHPEIPTLVLSMYDEKVYAERCLRAGAYGYVSKRQLDDSLLRAIRRLLDGEIYMTGELQRRLAVKCVGRPERGAGDELNALTDRELQVFRLIGEGRTTREIAEILNLSVKTIESHREHIKNKLTLESSAQMVQRATQWVEAASRAG
jgi:DNA-binding NarL/FixJ family response regulator